MSDIIPTNWDGSDNNRHQMPDWVRTEKFNKVMEELFEGFLNDNRIPVWEGDEVYLEVKTLFSNIFFEGLKVKSDYILDSYSKNIKRACQLCIEEGLEVRAQFFKRTQTILGMIEYANDTNSSLRNLLRLNRLEIDISDVKAELFDKKFFSDFYPPECSRLVLTYEQSLATVDKVIVASLSGFSKKFSVTRMLEVDINSLDNDAKARFMNGYIAFHLIEFAREMGYEVHLDVSNYLFLDEFALQRSLEFVNEYNDTQQIQEIITGRVMKSIEKEGISGVAKDILGEYVNQSLDALRRWGGKVTGLDPTGKIYRKITFDQLSNFPVAGNPDLIIQESELNLADIEESGRQHIWAGGEIVQGKLIPSQGRLIAFKDLIQRTILDRVGDDNTDLYNKLILVSQALESYKTYGLLKHKGEKLLDRANKLEAMEIELKTIKDQLRSAYADLPTEASLRHKTVRITPLGGSIGDKIKILEDVIHKSAIATQYLHGDTVGVLDNVEKYINHLKLDKQAKLDRLYLQLENKQKALDSHQILNAITPQIYLEQTDLSETIAICLGYRNVTNINNIIDILNALNGNQELRQDNIEKSLINNVVDLKGIVRKDLGVIAKQITRELSSRYFVLENVVSILKDIDQIRNQIKNMDGLLTNLQPDQELEPFIMNLLFKNIDNARIQLYLDSLILPTEVSEFLENEKLQETAYDCGILRKLFKKIPIEIKKLNVSDFLTSEGTLVRVPEVDPFKNRNATKIREFFSQLEIFTRLPDAHLFMSKYWCSVEDLTLQELFELMKNREDAISSKVNLKYLNSLKGMRARIRRRLSLTKKAANLEKSIQQSKEILENVDTYLGNPEGFLLDALGKLGLVVEDQSIINRFK